MYMAGMNKKGSYEREGLRFQTIYILPQTPPVHIITDRRTGFFCYSLPNPKLAAHR